jgi:TolB-like protein
MLLASGIQWGGPHLQLMAHNHQASKPTAAQVRTQRDRMLASKLFALSNRLKAFLNFVIDAELEGRADRLKEFTLGIEVFDKDESFDPNIDSIVRVEASRLRSKLREYYAGEGQDDPVRIDIPKGHYVPVFHLTHQEPEFEDLKSVRDADRSNRKLSFVVIGFMVAAILYLVVDNYLLEQAAPVFANKINDMSVAVLPFVPLSSGEDDGYFADGLTEEIINSLTQLPELRVTARTSSFFFKGKNLLVPDIASRLGVAHIVEGSVRREGNRLRIAAQLIHASDDVHLWSQTYDPTGDSVFAVQEEIAEKIAEVLGVVLDDAAREAMRSAGIHDVEAFIAYQKGREAFVNAHQGMNLSDALAIANTHFDRALEAAPDLTTARLMKADLRGHIIFEIAAGVRDENYAGELQETLAALREEYRLAIELSPPGNQRDLLDLERTLFSGNWTGFTFRIQKAVQPGRCPQVNWTALVAFFGWADQVVEKLREAITCNPMDTSASFQLAWALIWSGNSDAALRAIAEADNKGLSHPSLNDGRYWALLASGRVDDQRTPGPGSEASRMTYDPRILREALSGDPAIARRMANDYWSGPDTDDRSSIVIAAVIGDRERANEAAARIDAYPGSAVVISHAVFSCFCGAPFDLDAAPNYKARIEEAGFPWPPPKHIDYPAKTW